jgi:hypothetical protein
MVPSGMLPEEVEFHSMVPQYVTVMYKVAGHRVELWVEPYIEWVELETACYNVAEYT